MKSGSAMTSVGAVLDAVSAIADYAVQKETYEADCRIREELERYRQGLFESDSLRCRGVVVELAVCKTKYRLLQTKVMRLHSDVRGAFEPLLDELQKRIESLRCQHKRQM